MNSAAGDYVGGGGTRLVTPVDGTFTVSRNFDNGVSIATSIPNWWNLDFAAPGSAVLVPSIYGYATRFPFQSTTDAGLSVTGEGRGCNESVGRFVVREAVYASDGTPLRFAADFEQHCEGSAAALQGSIRYNSTVPLVAIERLTFTGNSPAPVGTAISWTSTSTATLERRG
jgi:hypothetical protein